jgi:hypothetical protein
VGGITPFSAFVAPDRKLALFLFSIMFSDQITIFSHQIKPVAYEEPSPW